MSHENDLVLDPFMGAGTTPATALLNKRRAAGAELMPTYYELALARVKQALVGDLPVRADKPVYKPKKSKLTTNPWQE
jgi:DNA modification methylase